MGKLVISENVSLELADRLNGLPKHVVSSADGLPGRGRHRPAETRDQVSMPLLDARTVGDSLAYLTYELRGDAPRGDQGGAL